VSGDADRDRRGRKPASGAVLGAGPRDATSGSADAAAEAAALLGAVELARLTGDPDGSVGASLDGSIELMAVDHSEADLTGATLGEPATLDLNGPHFGEGRGEGFGGGFDRPSNDSIAVVPIPLVDLHDEEEEGTMADFPQPERPPPQPERPPPQAEPPPPLPVVAARPRPSAEVAAARPRPSAEAVRAVAVAAPVRAQALPPELTGTAQRPAVARPVSVAAPAPGRNRRSVDQVVRVADLDRSEPTHQPMLSPRRAAPVQVSVPAPRVGTGEQDQVLDEGPSVILDFAGEAEHATQIFDTEDRADRARGRLVLTGGPDDGKTWYLNRPITTIGRSTENDIVLSDTAVSRRHLRVERIGNGFRVHDEGSGNGTWLNGQKASRDELFDGDRIMAGDSVLVFTTVGNVRPRPSAAERATDPAKRIGPASPPPPRTPRVPITWIAAWVLTTLAAVAVTVTVVRVVRHRRAQESRQVAEQHRQTAVSAVSRRDWEAARVALLAAREADPRLLDYADELRQLGQAAADAEAVERGQTALEAHDPKAAEEAVRGIDASSRYIFEARQMRTRAKDLRLSARVAEGRTALAQGRTEVARLIAEEVLALEVGNREARALLEAARQH
jgi:pSer/pThr/pTyr-binding forkhead associated (FHA) protein